MPTVSRTFAVTPTPATVIDYLKDFSHAEQWDPGTRTCTRQDDGPVRVGSSWHNVSTIVGVEAELTYTLESLEADQIVFVGRNDASTSTDTISVESHEGGSVITYRAHLEMHGAAKILTPAMKLVFEKLANDTERQLSSVLNDLSTTSTRAEPAGRSRSRSRR